MPWTARTPVGLLILIDNRQVAVTALGHHADRIAHGGADGDRGGRARHDVADRRRQIGAAGHLLQRIALGENADQLRAFADQHGAGPLRTKKLQHIADGVVGSRSQGLIGVGRAYTLAL